MTTSSNITFLSKQEKAEIKDIVLGLLCDCDIHNLPVELNSILSRRKEIILIDSDKAKKLKLIKNDYWDYDGETIYFDEYCYIIFNAKHPKVRQRWTIAHELGHVFLGHRKWTDIFEKEANYFAKQLLEPIAVLADMGAFTIDDIARVCGLSKKAAKYRMPDLKRYLSDTSKHGLTSHDIAFLRQYGRREVSAELCPAL